MDTPFSVLLEYSRPAYANMGLKNVVATACDHTVACILATAETASAKQPSYTLSLYQLSEPLKLASLSTTPIASAEVRTARPHLRVYVAEGCAAGVISAHTNSPGDSETFVFTLSSKKKLTVKELKGLPGRVTSAVFFAYASPLCSGLSKPATGPEEPAYDALVGTSAGALYALQLVKKDATHKLLCDLKAEKLVPSKPAFAIDPPDASAVYGLDYLFTNAATLKHLLSSGYADSATAGLLGDLKSRTRRAFEQVNFLLVFCIVGGSVCLLAADTSGFACSVLALGEFSKKGFLTLSGPELLTTKPSFEGQRVYPLTMQAALAFEQGRDVSYRVVSQALPNDATLSTIEVHLDIFGFVAAITLSLAGEPTVSDFGDRPFVVDALASAASKELGAPKLSSAIRAAKACFRCDAVSIQLAAAMSDSLFKEFLPPKLSDADPIARLLKAPGVFLGAHAFKHHTAFVYTAAICVYSTVSNSVLAVFESPLVPQFSEGAAPTSLDAYYQLRAGLPQRLPVFKLTPTHPTFLLAGKPMWFEVGTQNEDANLWRIYYNRRMYDKALGLCTDEAYKKLIRMEYAQECLDSGKELLGARLLAQSDVGVLQGYKALLARGLYTAAASFVRTKLEAIPAPPQYRQLSAAELAVLDVLDEQTYNEVKARADAIATGRTVCAHMLLEAYLMQYSALKDRLSQVSGASAGASEDVSRRMEAEDNVSAAKDTLAAFLQDPTTASVLREPVVKSSLLARSLTDLYLAYCTATGNRTELLAAQLAAGQYGEAFSTIRVMPPEALHFYAALLIERLPHRFFDFLKASLKAQMESKKKAPKFDLMQLVKPFLETSSRSTSVNDLVRQFLSFVVLDARGVAGDAFVKFAIEFLFKCGDQETIAGFVDAMDDSSSSGSSSGESSSAEDRPDRLSIEQLLGMCRRYAFATAEMLCLKRLHNALASVQLSLQLNRTVELTEVEFGYDVSGLLSNVVRSVFEYLSPDAKLFKAYCAQNKESTVDDYISHLIGYTLGKGVLSTMPRTGEINLGPTCEAVVNSCIALLSTQSTVPKKQETVALMVDWLLALQLVDTLEYIDIYFAQDNVARRQSTVEQLAAFNGYWKSAHTPKDIAYAVLRALFARSINERVVAYVRRQSFMTTESMVRLFPDTAPLGSVKKSIADTFQDRAANRSNITDAIAKNVRDIEAQRNDITTVNKKPIVVAAAGDAGPIRCTLCNAPLGSAPAFDEFGAKRYKLLGRPREVPGERQSMLYTSVIGFPCMHYYHTHCVVRFLEESVSAPSSLLGLVRRYRDLLRAQESSAPKREDSAAVTDQRGLCDEILRRLEGECALCGRCGIEAVFEGINGDFFMIPR